MILLKPMTAPDFALYMTLALPKYAESKRKGEGLSQKEAERVATASYETLLPQGLATKDNFFFHLIDEKTEKPVGALWLALKPQGAARQLYIYDIEIDKAARGKGYGRKALELVEAKAKTLGASSIGLHVFGFNEAARALYEKSGFRATNIVMVKEL
jgi:RimJ/RimL family protein N-acetyltransferase